MTGLGIGIGIGLNHVCLPSTPSEPLITQPIALTNADGVVLTTAEGTVLVRGTKRVTPLDTWILRNGVWDDSGYWDDSRNWKD